MHEWMSTVVAEIPTHNIKERVSHWMERKMVLQESDYKGLFDFRVTPYLREIVDELSPRSKITESVLMKGAQLGGSTASFGYIAFCIDHGIGPGLFVSGDQEMAEETFEKRLDPIIHNSGLSDKIKPAVRKRNSRTTGDTKALKSYGGTFFRAIGPHSESKLRSFPARAVIVEEIDVFPMSLKGKGNPVEKIVRRTDAFGANKRIFYNSTPKLRGESQIEKLYEMGDRRLYYVPCPVCGRKQPLVWDRLRWEKNDDGSPAIRIDDESGALLHDPTYYVCENEECDARWKNEDKVRFLNDKKAGGMVLPNGRHVWAEWVPQGKSQRPGLRSRQMSTLYSPTLPWWEMAMAWHRAQKDKSRMPDFVNDFLGETYYLDQETPEPHHLQARAERWECGEIPKGVLFLTLAADIQKDRIEAGLVGWGENQQSWALNYWVFEGKPNDLDSECWNELDKVISAEYQTDDGRQLRPMITFVDAGYLTQQVETFCDRFDYSDAQMNGVYPIEGAESGADLYARRKSNIKTPKLQLHDQKLKAFLYDNLNKKRAALAADYPPGYVHFPSTYGKDWYEQLTAEVVEEITDSYGRTRRLIVNKHQKHNEVLDIMKMNLAAYYYSYRRYFEIINDKRKRRGRKPVPVEADVFIREIMRASGIENRESKGSETAQNVE